MVKHYRVKGVKVPTQPAALFEARLDLFDHRSGYRSSETGIYLGDWLIHREMSWTKDMVTDSIPVEMMEFDPPNPLEWPEYLDDKIIEYFMRFVRVKIWSNPFLEFYSRPGDTHEQFIDRCEYFLLKNKESEIEKLKEVYLHRFLSIEQDLLISSNEVPWDPELGEKRAVRIRGLFSGIRDGFSQLSLRDIPSILGDADFTWKGRVDVESQEKLEGLRREFISNLNKEVETCLEQARLTEEYEVPVNHSQVDILSRAILWR